MTQHKPWLGFTETEFWRMIHHREHRMAEVLNISNDWYSSKRSRDIDGIIMIENINIDIHDIFHETTEIIGENWLWAGGRFYFVKQSDAMWFALRWTA